jgi:HD-GYP domain-containing protein (c-di-GMP phosphodiesterase class II)
MLDLSGEVTGVLQALNKSDGGTFDEEDEELLLALGSQAAVAIENAQLSEDIIELFEGFIRASVYAIEARDPTTSGHSERVAALSVGLARAYNQIPQSRREITISEAQLRELRYAALLHDFGKVSVRESVLVKAKKLYPHQIRELRYRFDYVAKQQEVAMLRGQLALRDEVKDPQELAQRMAKLEAAYRLHIETFEGYWDLILRTNMPNVVATKESHESLHEIAACSYQDPQGRTKPMLSPEEMTNLQIRVGSLNEAERKEIQNHVAYTYKFLCRIPWTRDLQNVPDIAGKHHEKLDGSGYPYRVGPTEIPIQTRMMTVCDIYDALTARDRPYKRAVPHRRALDILQYEANDGKIDCDLLDLFVEARVYERLYVLDS